MLPSDQNTTSGAQRLAHVFITGRVQGVAYRAWTEEEALRGGLEGWVRNRRDGSVEAMFFGPAAAVEDMISACRSGPSGARVDRIEQVEATSDLLDERYPGERFSVLATR